MDIKWFWWLYYLNEDCHICSYDRLKYNGKVNYTLKWRRLKYYKRKSPNWAFYYVVDLYPEFWVKKKLFVHKIIYATYNNLDYKKITRLHFKDDNTLNTHIDNIYYMNEQIKKDFIH